ncbi:hypothetical protein J4442_04465 [Candidatus Woesearchaeota archaeon]|nr:hypothetical protein [Candidatus Woesearchaeota archaeon]
MKEKISVTIDRSVLDRIIEFVEEGRFRNKSHVVEYSLNKLIKENAKL